MKPWHERWYTKDGGVLFPDGAKLNGARLQLAVYAPELYRQLDALLKSPNDPEARRKAEKVLRHARGEYPEDHGQWAGDDEL